MNESVIEEEYEGPVEGVDPAAADGGGGSPLPIMNRSPTIGDAMVE